MTSSRPQSEAASSSRPSSAAPATDRSQASRPGSVDGDPGGGELLVQGPGVAGAGRMEDRPGPTTARRRRRRPPRCRTAARTSSSGSAQARTSVNGRPAVVGPSSRDRGAGPGRPRRVEDALAPTAPWRRARARAPAPNGAERAVGRRGGCLGGLGEIDGVGEAASVQVGRAPPPPGDTGRRPPAAPAQGGQRGSGTAPQARPRRRGSPPTPGGARTSSASQRRDARAVVRMASRSTGGGRQAQPPGRQHGDAELADQLVDGGAVDVGDAAAPLGRRRGPEGPAGEQRRVGRGRHHRHRREGIGLLGASCTAAPSARDRPVAVDGAARRSVSGAGVIAACYDPVVSALPRRGLAGPPRGPRPGCSGRALRPVGVAGAEPPPDGEGVAQHVRPPLGATPCSRSGCRCEPGLPPGHGGRGRRAITSISRSKA